MWNSNKSAVSCTLRPTIVNPNIGQWPFFQMLPMALVSSSAWDFEQVQRNAFNIIYSPAISPPPGHNATPK